MWIAQSQQQYMQCTCKYTINTHIHKYNSHNNFKYVCIYMINTWLTHGENVHGIQCLPTQTFYCIPKQPPNPQHHRHATVGTTPVMMSTWMAKHTTLYNRDTNTTRCWPCVKFHNSSVVVVPVRASLELVWPAHWTKTAGLLSSPCMVCVDRCDVKWGKSHADCMSCLIGPSSEQYSTTWLSRDS